MKKFLTIVGLLTVVATPALAQSFNPSFGTGNELPFAYKSTAQDTQSVARTNGNESFAMDRGGKANIDPDSPANTGGGSDGYNWNLDHNY